MQSAIQRAVVPILGSHLPTSSIFGWCCLGRCDYRQSALPA